MTARMLDVSRWIGLPYQDRGRGPAYDCWGGVCAVLREHGISLHYDDLYVSAEDVDSVSNAITTVTTMSCWRRVELPRPLDVVVFDIRKRPWHVGLCIGGGRFLHWPEPSRGHDGTSRIEGLGDPMWRNRIEGVYRYG